MNSSPRCIGAGTFFQIISPFQSFHSILTAERLRRRMSGAGNDQDDEDLDRVVGSHTRRREEDEDLDLPGDDESPPRKKGKTKNSLPLKGLLVDTVLSSECVPNQALECRLKLCPKAHKRFECWPAGMQALACRHAGGLQATHPHQSVC